VNDTPPLLLKTFASVRRKLLSIPFVWQLAGLFVGQVLLIFSVMYLFSWKSNLALIDGLTHELQSKAGAQISDNLTAFLDSAIENNYRNALLTRDRNLSDPRLASWKSLFIDETSRSKTLTNVALATVDGEYVGVEKASSGQLVYQVAGRETGHALQSVKTDGSGTDGNELSRVAGYDPRTRPWFVAAVETQKPCWSDVYKHYADDVLQLAASHPVYDSNNKLKGVLVSAVRLTYLSDFLKSIQFSKAAHVIIVDHKGLLVASTSDAALFRHQKGVTDRIGPTDSDDPFIREMGTALKTTFGQVSHFRYAGRTINVNITKYQHPQGLAWSIISAVPEDALLGHLAKEQGKLHGAMAVLLSLAVLSSLWMGRRIARPLAVLNRAVTEFADGRPPRPVTLDRTDELGNLAESFNKMTCDLTGFATSQRDSIRQLEAANKALESAESKYRLLFENNNDAIYVRSFTESGGVGTFIEVNEVACRRLGYSRDELLQMTTNDINAPESCTCLENIRRALTEQGEAFFETSHRTKDGRILPVEINSHQFMLDGKPVILSVARDITERKRSEDALHKLSRAVEQSPVTIIITDLRGDIEFVNPKFTQLTGYSSEEAIGQNPRILKSGQTPAEVYRDLWRTVTLGNVWEGELLNRGKGDRLFWEHTTISPLRDMHGNVTHYLAIKEDITEKKNILDQLAQSQKIESIGQLAGGLAHDFNNILSVISGYAYLMRISDPLDQEQSKNLDQIISASSRAAELTHSLLAYSRKQIMNPQNQSLNDLIGKTGSFISRLIGETIKLNISLRDDPLQVLVDSGQLEQVLLNLATNARDAMPQGGILSIATVEIAVDEQFVSSHGYGEVGRYAVITVTDSGSGMNEQTRQRIFDPFFTTKEVGKGTGLGMSMVLGIIQQHNGFIDVQSAIGQGTTFRIYLPITDEGDTMPVSETTELLTEQSAGTILVAEDEPSVRDFMEKLLTLFGYRVILAVDGQDAVEKFSAMKDEIQLVIFDMVMPNKSGKAAWNEIRRINNSIKAIYVSGYAADVIERQGDLGPDEMLLKKPIQPKELMDNIRQLLKK
jgi:PAS domain S-box-containing protein